MVLVPFAARGARYARVAWRCVWRGVRFRAGVVRQRGALVCQVCGRSPIDAHTAARCAGRRAAVGKARNWSRRVVRFNACRVASVTGNRWWRAVCRGQ